MAKGSESDISQDEKELSIDLMTISCFETDNNESGDNQMEHFFITNCYGRHKSLLDVIVPRIPKKYAAEEMEKTAVLYEPCPLERVPSPFVNPGNKSKNVAGRGRARLLQEQVETSQATQRSSVQPSSNLPPSVSLTERAECILIDQSMDSLSYNRTWRKATTEYDVKSQQDFPSLSDAGDDVDSSQRKNQRKGRRRQIQSLKKLGRQIVTSEFFGNSNNSDGDCGDRIRGAGVDQGDDVASYSQRQTSRLDHLNFDNDDDDDGIGGDGGEFDDVAVEDCDSMYAAVRRENGSSDSSAAASGLFMAAAGQAGSQNSDNGECLDVGCANLDNVDDVKSTAAKKLRSWKMWKVEGSDVIQFDSVPKGGEKQLENLISHYAKVMKKEKKARSGGKYSVRFRLQAEDSSAKLDLDWIVECFHGDEGIFPGTTLECYQLKDQDGDETKV